MPNSPMRTRLAPLRTFLQSNAAGGIVLMASAALALLAANSPFQNTYFTTLQQHVGGLSLLHWINDALMALFFLLVGLEIKRELLIGNLNSWPARLLPGLAAVGGMVVPALVYVAWAGFHTPATHGWAIPMATDIAFALGVLALLGSRVPTSLKVFLTALAIIDDLGAVLVIALFYTSSLSWPMLAAAAGILVLLYGLNRAGVRSLWSYLLLGLLLWVCIFKSGMHATMAGVLLATAIPLSRHNGFQSSPLLRLEHTLSPWVAFLILPLFGFANAGVSLAGITGSQLTTPVTAGVALGLLLGKQIGVFGAVWLAVKAGIAQRPAHATWRQIYGVAVLCGVGFTMSLFIGLLAFSSNPDLITQTKLGVLLGSLACMALSAIIISCPTGTRRRKSD